jgi:hypothetical protein
MEYAGVWTLHDAALRPAAQPEVDGCPATKTLGGGHGGGVDSSSCLDLPQSVWSRDREQLSLALSISLIALR